MTVIDPTYDAGFKLIFGRENVSEELLIDLLNAIFAEDPDFNDIVSLRYLNSEHQHERLEGNSIRYDIMCETSSGHRFIVEMQKTWQRHFIARAVYYVSRLIAEQGYRSHRERDWKYSLTPVVGLFICNFDHDELPRKAVTIGGLTDYETGEPLGHYTRYVFIQLPNFSKAEADCHSEIDKWIFNIKNMGIMQNVAFTRQNAVFQRLENISNVASLSESERRQYEADLKFARDYNAQMSGALELGHARGFKEGRQEGRKEGLQAGILQTAVRLLQRDYPIESVADITELPIETLKRLEEDLDK